MFLFEDFSLHHILKSCTVIVPLLMVFWFLNGWRNKKLNLPPGPKGLPIVGYVPFLGNRPYKHFMELKKKYGNVLGLYLGGRFTVILSDIAAVKEAYSKNELSARPHGFFKLNEKYDNIANMSGKLWVEHARFNKTVLRNVGMGKDAIEDAIQEQLEITIKKIDAKIAAKKDVYLREVVCISADNVIFSMICGKTIPDEDPKSQIFHEFQRQCMRYFAMNSTLLYLPWLKPILRFLPFYKEVKKATNNMENLLNSEIKSHEDHLNPAEPSDFMDHFLLQIERTNGVNGYTREVLNGHSQFFLLGGSETGRSNIEWSIMLLAKHQDCQDRAYKEIVNTIGPEKEISWKDRDSLPYNYAVLMETLRRKSTGPLSIARRVQKETKIFDFDLPKNTYVMTNLWSVHMNPEVWPEPKMFNPERFLSPDGKSIKNVESFIPFSYGQRKCPGEKLALVQGFITLTTLIQKFQFLPPDNGLDFTKEISLVYVAKNSTVKVLRR